MAGSRGRSRRAGNYVSGRPFVRLRHGSWERGRRFLQGGEHKREGRSTAHGRKRPEGREGATWGKKGKKPTRR